MASNRRFKNILFNFRLLEANEISRSESMQRKARKSLEEEVIGQLDQISQMGHECENSDCNYCYSPSELSTPVPGVYLYYDHKQKPVITRRRSSSDMEALRYLSTSTTSASQLSTTRSGLQYLTPKQKGQGLRRFDVAVSKCQQCINLIVQ